MIEDDAPPQPDSAGDMLLYDYFKWLTTLALLTLGGVLSLAQTASLKLDDREIALVLGPLCAAGAAAWMGADGIVRRRTGGRKPWLAPRTYVLAATGALGIGVGSFISLFWTALK